MYSGMRPIEERHIMDKIAPAQATSVRTSTDYPRLADTVIRAGRIYSMAADRLVYRAIAIRDEWIVAVSEDAHGLDGLISADTHVVDDAELTLLPALCDTHNHLFELVENIVLVPVDRARSIAEFVELIRQRAAQTPSGQWIRTTNAWNEANLAEKRLPTASELDAATRDHPVLVRRGGHVAVANSRALQLAGIGPDTPNPSVGALGRLPDGTLSGMLEGAAAAKVTQIVPPLSLEERIAGIRQSCAIYTSLGLGAVRAPMVQQEQMLAYQAAWERGALTLRCRPLINIMPFGSVADRVAAVAQWGVRSGFGDDLLRIWGLKFVMDSGVEGAALERPYANNPNAYGHLNWEPADMIAVANAAVRNGWKIGTHAVGDRAVRTLLDVYEQVVHDNPGLPPGTLVIEHAFLADKDQRSRAIRLGVAITVQHSLLYGRGRDLVRLWGADRAREIMPVRAWVEEGAQISAGTDYPADSYDPMKAIWGMITRQTQDVGVQGPEYAVDPYTAFYLYTAAGAKLDGEENRRGTLQPRRLADLVAYRKDPITAPVDDLPSLRPAFTIVGGQPMHDPAGLLTRRD